MVNEGVNHWFSGPTAAQTQFARIVTILFLYNSIHYHLFLLFYVHQINFNILRSSDQYLYSYHEYILFIGHKTE